VGAAKDSEAVAWPSCGGGWLDLGVDDVGRSEGAVLAVGSSGRFEGTYHLHWEWSRLEIVVRSRWRRRRVWCELISETVPWPAAIERAAAAGGRGPEARFAVVVDADVVARGHFGHKGSLTWQLSVRRWVAVEPLP
jgi:hypothetical protein